MTQPENPFASPEPGTPQQEPQSPGQQHAQPQYGQPPYGQPPPYGQQQYAQQPYGQHPYGGPPPYGPPYGAPPAYYGPPPGYYGIPASARTNGLAIASLVLGCLWIYWLGSVLALVFGYVARSQIRQRGEQGAGLATAGIVLGWIGVGILALVVVAGLAGAFDSEYTY